MAKAYFLIVILFSQALWANNCLQKPVPSLDCAAELLLKEGLAHEADRLGWNVYQWPQEINKNSEILSKEVDRNIDLSPKSNSYFFWVDREPGGLFNHGTEFIFVTKKSGKITRFFQQGYPQIDGISYFAQPIESLVDKYIPKGFKRYPWKGQVTNLVKVIPFAPLGINQLLPKEFVFQEPSLPDVSVPNDSSIDWKHYEVEIESEKEFQRRVRGYYEKGQSPNQAKQESTKCDCPVKTGPKRVLLISGFNLSGERDDLDETARLYKNLGLSVTYLRSQASEFQLSGVKTIETSIKNIENAFDEIAAQTSGCCDEVDVIFGGHGSAKGFIEMNPRGEEEIYDGKVSYIPPRFVEIGVKGGGNLTTRDLNSLLNKIKSCQVKVYFFSCYSGSHLVRGLNKVDKSLVSQGCMCRATFVSSSQRQVTFRSDFMSFCPMSTNWKVFS